MLFLLRPLQRAALSRPCLRFQSSLARCPSCSKPFTSHIPACTSCWSIHPLPPNLSHHDLLDVPYHPNPFLVHLPTLQSHFRKAQASCHPDAWASKSSKELNLAHTLSSKLNEAYQTLLNPLKRAEYILERNGVHMSETDKVEDKDFMVSVMEARETIHDATGYDVEKVVQLEYDNEENIKAVVDQLKSLIEQQKWAEAKTAAIRLRYLQGIQRAIKSWLDQYLG